MKIRILQVIESLNPAKGGMQAVVMRLAAAQAARGNEVHLLYYDEIGIDEQVQRIGKSIPSWERVQLRRITGATFREKFTGKSGMQAFADIATSIDVVHLHGVWEPFLTKIAKHARKINKPYVITLHGLLDPWALNQKRFKKLVALRFWVRKFLNHAAFIHLLNSDEKQRIERLNLKAPQEILPNGIFLEEFAALPAAQDFIERFPQIKSPFILFLSRLHFKKGLDILADAFAIVARVQGDIELVVAGPDEGAKLKFEEQIKALGLEKRVHLVGPLYGRAKSEALSSAACFCLPSRMEGFSIAIVEALAAGLPAVVSEECRFPEVAQSGAGEVTALDAQSIAEALQRVLQHDKLQYGTAGRELVRQNYTWPIIAERMCELYLRCLAQQR